MRSAAVRAARPETARDARCVAATPHGSIAGMMANYETLELSNGDHVRILGFSSVLRSELAELDETDD